MGRPLQALTLQRLLKMDVVLLPRYFHPPTPVQVKVVAFDPILVEVATQFMANRSLSNPPSVALPTVTSQHMVDVGPLPLMACNEGPVLEAVTFELLEEARDGTLPRLPRN
jgi:hypothetical protein